MKILIWGTGNMAKEYLETEEIPNDDIIGFVETKKTKNSFMGKPVFEPKEIPQFDCMFVMVRTAELEIVECCIQNKIDTKKVILLNNWKWNFDEDLSTDIYPDPIAKKILPECVNLELLKSLYPILFNRFIKHNDEFGNRYQIMRRCGYDLIDDNNPIKLIFGDNREYKEDYFRYRTFVFSARQIEYEKVEGCVAEAGVAYGNFAKLINIMFPERRLYLFDTFNSFDNQEFDMEVEKGYVDRTFSLIHEDCNADTIIREMPYPQNIVIKKGLFPDTTQGLESERYAFVSLDLDLEESTLKGLQYFYPRMSEGGMIFLHDYHNSFLQGVREAVSRYEDEIGIRMKKIPMSDGGGTLVILK